MGFQEIGLIVLTACVLVLLWREIDLDP